MLKKFKDLFVPATNARCCAEVVCCEGVDCQDCLFSDGHEDELFEYRLKQAGCGWNKVNNRNDFPNRTKHYLVRLSDSDEEADYYTSTVHVCYYDAGVKKFTESVTGKEIPNKWVESWASIPEFEE